jgi:hypothetical protein
MKIIMGPELSKPFHAFAGKFGIAVGFRAPLFGLIVGIRYMAKPDISIQFGMENAVARFLNGPYIGVSTIGASVFGFALALELTGFLGRKLNGPHPAVEAQVTKSADAREKLIVEARASVFGKDPPPDSGTAGGL